MPLAVSEGTSTEVSVLGNVGFPCALLPAALLRLGTEGPQDLGGRQIENLQVTRPTQQPLMICQYGPLLYVRNTTTTRLKCQQCWLRAEPLAIVSNPPSTLHLMH